MIKAFRKQLTVSKSLIFTDSGFLQGKKCPFQMCLTLGSVPTNIDSGRYFVVIYSQLMTELAQL